MVQGRVPVNTRTAATNSKESCESKKVDNIAASNKTFWRLHVVADMLREECLQQQAIKQCLSHGSKQKF
jgi:hypothetical protein